MEDQHCLENIVTRSRFNARLLRYPAIALFALSMGFMCHASTNIAAKNLPKETKGIHSIERKKSDSIPNLIYKVDEHILKKHICYLTSNGEGCESNGNRILGSEGSLIARNYIIENLEGGGWQVSLQNFRYMYDYDKIERKGANVIATKKGTSNNAIVFCAHYDTKSDIGSDIAPGANDNASGIAVLLEIGSIFGKLKFKDNIILIATDSEEIGHNGAKAILGKKSNELIQRYADIDNPLQQYSNVKVICADSIGYNPFGPKGKISIHVGYEDQSSINESSIQLASIISRFASRYTEYGSQIISPGAAFGDGAEFSKDGLTAVSLGWQIKDPIWHTDKDIEKRIDYGFLKANAQSVIATIYSIAGASRK